MIQNNIWSTVKKQAREFNSVKGWETIGDKHCYFKSKAEVKCAYRLQTLKEMELISEWEYEPQVFYFEGIKRGCTNYTPDFKVILPNEKHFWIEVKGYMDAKSRTKINRFLKYFKEEDLLVIEKEKFLMINIEIEKYSK